MSNFPMMVRHYLRLFWLMLLSLALSLALAAPSWLSVVIASPPPISQSDQREQQAKIWYQQGELNLAIQSWQKIASDYQQQGAITDQARILTYLALAYTQLGQWNQAQQTINQSLSLLDDETTRTADHQRLSTLAEAWNVQGTLELGKGDALSALSSWEKATAIYQQINEPVGILRSQINQGRALQQLGLYQRSCSLLVTALETQLSCDRLTLDSLKTALSNALPNLTPVHREGWMSLGEVLGQLGQLESSVVIFEQLLDPLPPGNERGTLLLKLGQTWQRQGNNTKAQALYQQAIASATHYDTQVQAQLAQLNLIRNEPDSQTQESLIRELIQTIDNLSLSQTKIDAQLNLAQQLIETAKPNDLGQIRPSWDQIAQLLIQAQENAQSIQYKRGLAYSIGDRGRLYEQLALAKTCQQSTVGQCRQSYQFRDLESLNLSVAQLWENAQKLTELALIQSQTLQAPEMSYLWQWQLGRILAALGKRADGIKAYLTAVSTLQTLTLDLGTNRESQLSFQDQVEPVYRELLSLLLPQTNQEIVSQDQLQLARQQIEALQAAELNNFFRDVCVQNQPVSIEEIDPNAAVIYPLILSDRFVVLLSLPNQPLQVSVNPIEQEQLEQVVKDFRYTMVVRSQRQFFVNAQQLYDWLIRPFNAKLQQNAIKTLVFVPDGILRNIPMAALYDGQNYLIEAYGVSLTPGLTLLSPESLQKKGLNTLFGGLTGVSPQPGFIPLFYIEEELQAIRSQVSSTALLNENFTLKDLQRTLENQSFPIVHFATHGQFSSQFEETFIVTWNSRINILELEQLLQESEATGQTAIELLILSACETAAGDRRAALGLAGLAVRAGARSTIATLWSVNDQGTALLMKQFYRQLATQKLSKAEALRQAQLSLLKNRWFRHPFYWSSYILVGNWL